jgi:thiosulfate dehydrogenase
MARLNTAASFVRHNMPFGQECSLTDQEAFDIAAYFIQQPRPDFKKNIWMAKGW